MKGEGEGGEGGREGEARPSLYDALIRNPYKVRVYTLLFVLTSYWASAHGSAAPSDHSHTAPGGTITLTRSPTVDDDGDDDGGDDDDGDDDGSVGGRGRCRR